MKTEIVVYSRAGSGNTDDAEAHPVVPPTMPLGLKPRQARFVAEYLLDLNATRAAVRSGYSAKTATVQAARLFTNVHLREAVRAAIEARSARVEIDAGFVLLQLRLEAERVGPGASHSARVRALELLGKHVGLFTDRHDEPTKVEATPPAQRDIVTVSLSGVNLEERQAIVAILKKADERKREPGGATS